MRREGAEEKKKEGESATAFKTSQNPVRARARGVFRRDSLSRLTGARSIRSSSTRPENSIIITRSGARRAMIGTSKLNLFAGMSG